MGTQARLKEEPDAPSSLRAAAPVPAYARPWRALALGVGGVLLLSAVTPYNDYHIKNTPLYMSHLPLGGLFLFAVLAMAVNPLLRRYLPRYALRPGELLLFWAMVSTGAGLAASGLWRYLAPMVVAPAYFSGGAGKDWLSLFQQAPDWLILSKDPQSPLVTGFYQGLPPGASVPYLAWIKVVAGWGLAFGLVMAFSIGMCALFRKQWVVRERLSYPLVQVPLQIVADEDSRGTLLRNRVFWAGCLTVIVLHTLSALHYFAPSFPGFPDSIETRGWFPNPPWSALNLPTLYFYFGIIGATFLLPTDVSLSLWLLYIALRLVRVLRVMRGYEPLAVGPLDHEHAMAAGAFLTLVVWLFWVARPHWRAVWEQVKRPQVSAEREEPLSARAALGLVALGLIGLPLWLNAAGMRLVFAVPFVLLFFVLILALTRFVAESGLLVVDAPYLPTHIISLWGTHAFTPLSSGVSLQTDVILVHDPAAHPMPAIGNAYALTGASRMHPRLFTWAIVLALVVGFGVSFVSTLWLNYHFGAVTLDEYGAVRAPNWSLDAASSYVTTPLPGNIGLQLYVGVGAVLAMLLIALKTRFLWWPLGPIGLAMGPSWAMDHLYFSVFLGWVCKVSVLYLGGLRLFARAMPFFLGLLLGEGLFGGVAAIWGLLTGIKTPAFFPNS